MLTLVIALASFIFIQPALWLLLGCAFYFYILVPVLDLLVGYDTENPPEEVTAAMSTDPYYDYIAYAMIPICFALFILSAYIITNYELPFWASLILILGVGMINGNTMTVAHELGHRNTRLNRLMTKISLSLSGYGHFTVEHNAGHHVKVATPEDCASSKMGETIYQFILREIPGTFLGAYRLQAKRMKAQGLSFWHWKNDILQVYAITLMMAAVMIVWLGPKVLPFILLHHFLVWYTLTQANYIEHYGLLRQKKANGKYERCQPKHSWNTNHRVSNLVTLHLQRHSDHHANPMRPYQTLRDFKDVPSLPSGYPGCWILAAIPPLWFAVMDRRVMAWANGRIDEINMTEKKRVQLSAKQTYLENN